ncbi:hypothetical protein AFAEFNGA_00401 [Mycoplasmopsis arginini]|nr:hypothetical protein [Mycoplasmopsis arginini]MDI3351034.1 hypothetical protein [Mycoplasmopsis arginini]
MVWFLYNKKINLDFYLGLYYYFEDKAFLADSTILENDSG